MNQVIESSTLNEYTGTHTLTHRVVKIKNQVASLIGASHPKVVEVMKPRPIPGVEGLQMSIHIHLSHVRSILL